MAEKQLTITELLRERKTLDARIRKEVNLLVPATVKKGDKFPAGVENQESFEAEATSGFQKVRDLITRRNKIDAALIISNAAKEVVVGGKPMKVAVAITRRTTPKRKGAIEFDKLLLNHLVGEFDDIKDKVDSHNAAIDKKVDAMVKARMESSAEGINEDDIRSVVKGMHDRDYAVMVDPLGLAAKTKEMSEEIEQFESDVDVVLTISNSTTTIDLDKIQL